jgi:DNA-binding SARP family transcriptional activator
MDLLRVSERGVGRKPQQASGVARALDDLALLHQQWGALNDQFSRQLKALHALLDASASYDDERAICRKPLYATYFGRFGIYRGGAPLALGRSRASVELCRYLIARAGDMVARDELLELLWPDSTPNRTGHRLHVAVSQLRQALDPEGQPISYIQHEDDHYSIGVSAVLTDCHLFDTYYSAGKERLARRDHHGAASAFEAALSLYKGDYLSDHLYAEWTHSPRAHYAEQRLNALVFLCEHAAHEERLAGVLDYAQQILRIDNLQELAHRWLMRVYHRTGQRALAIRQYKTCADLLQQELGVSPSGQTECLHAAIRSDAPLPVEASLFL